MSARHQERTVCQDCGARCRSTPLEVAVHGGTGHRGHWVWNVIRLCPVCRSALQDFLLGASGGSRRVRRDQVAASSLMA